MSEETNDTKECLDVYMRIHVSQLISQSEKTVLMWERGQKLYQTKRGFKDEC